MAKGNFGERLKRERELREVSPNEVVVATRISLRFLEALENEDWGKLPGGVFNRGFVRAIARYLGLDEEHLLAEYDLARGDQSPGCDRQLETARHAHDLDGIVGNAAVAQPAARTVLELCRQVGVEIRDDDHERFSRGVRQPLALLVLHSEPPGFGAPNIWPILSRFVSM